MSDIPPPAYNNPEWQLQPQASYPGQPNSSYNTYPPQVPAYLPQEGMMPRQQMPAYPPQAAMMPQQPAPYPQPYAAYPPQPVPQYQVPPNPYAQPVNISINNVQNGYVPQEVFDPFRGAAVTALTCGIVAVLIWIIPFVGSLASLICAIVGVINGIKGRQSTTRAGSAVTGLILSILALVIIAGTVFFFVSILFISHASTNAIHSATP
jgi:hypothetical protein